MRSGPVRFVVVGSPEYFARHGRPKHPNELLAHHCIPIRLGPNRLYDRWEFEQNGKEFEVQAPAGK